MALQLPPDLARLMSAVTGMSWPECDEDELRSAGDDYLVLEKDLSPRGEDIGRLMARCLQEFEGRAASLFEDTVRKLTGPSGQPTVLNHAATTASQLAGTAYATANQVEYAKWMIIGTLVQLALETAVSEFWAPFTGGVDVIGLVVAYGLARETLETILEWLVTTVGTLTVAGVSGALVMDQTIQRIQITRGHRSGIDGDTTSAALEFGLLGGILAGPMELVGAGLGRVLGSLFGRDGGTLFGDELADALLSADKGHPTFGAREPSPAAEIRSGQPDRMAEPRPLQAEPLEESAVRLFARDLGAAVHTAAGSPGFGLRSARTDIAKAAFADATARVFSEHLGWLVGTDQARELGGDFGRAFASDWRGADNSVLSQSLRTVLDSGAIRQVLPGSETAALAHWVPLLADRMSGGDRVYQLGVAIGEHLANGAHNNLSEGFYGLVFTDAHEFSTTWESFVAGAAMGLLGKVLHSGLSPLTTGAALVHDWIATTMDPVHAGGSGTGYFGTVAPADSPVAGQQPGRIPHATAGPPGRRREAAGHDRCAGPRGRKNAHSRRRRTRPAGSHREHFGRLSAHGRPPAPRRRAVLARTATHSPARRPTDNRPRPADRSAGWSRPRRHRHSSDRARAPGRHCRAFPWRQPPAEAPSIEGDRHRFPRTRREKVRCLLAKPRNDRFIWHTRLDPHHGGPIRLEEFRSRRHAASFLSQFGVKYGRTLHLRDGHDPSASQHERAARDTLTDPAFRLTLAAHGEADHVRVGDYRLGPRAVAQLLRVHPDWHRYRHRGVRLLACDTGRPVGNDHPFAERLAEEIGEIVIAPTAKVWTSADGVSLVADIDLTRPHHPVQVQGAFRAFAPPTRTPISTRGHVSSARAPRAPDSAGFDHPRWHENVVQWSPPYTAAPKDPEGNPVLAPWYSHAVPGVAAWATPRWCASPGRPIP